MSNAASKNVGLIIYSAIICLNSLAELYCPITNPPFLVRGQEESGQRLHEQRTVPGFLGERGIRSEIVVVPVFLLILPGVPHELCWRFLCCCRALEMHELAPRRNK